MAGSVVVIPVLSCCYPGVHAGVAGSMSRLLSQLLSRCYPSLHAGADGPFQPGAGPSCSVDRRGATPSPVNPLKERIIRSAPKTHLIPAAQAVSHGRAWMNPELIFQALLFLGPGETPVSFLCVPKGVRGAYFGVTLWGQELSSIWCCKCIAP